MQNVQEAFVRLQDLKKQQKDLRTIYRDAFKNSSEYQDIIDQMKALREKKRRIEQDVRGEYTREFEKLDEVTTELRTGTELMTTMVLDGIMKGEIVKVRDAYNTTYDPVIKISFKKSDEQGN